MKKLLMFFSGIFLIGLIFAALYFSGALFDATDRRNIQAFVFQPNNLSMDRIGRPVPIDQLSDKFVRDRLIKKFINEYFYVIPQNDNISMRTRSDSILAALSSQSVFIEWKKTEAEEISKLSDKLVMRKAVVTSIVLPQDSQYWDINYDLVTWEKPGQPIETLPKITSGVMHIKLSFEKGVRNQRGGKDFDIGKYLNEGGDPAAIFKFRVEEVRR